MTGPWKDYTADLSGIELYKHLSDKNLAVTDGNGVYGLPYVIEGYGIIYNNAIMDKYFAVPDAKAKSMDEVNNFATLKAVADDMQAKKDQLGIGGVFCSTSLKPGKTGAGRPTWPMSRSSMSSGTTKSMSRIPPPPWKSSSNMRIISRISLTCT